MAKEIGFYDIKGTQDVINNLMLARNEMLKRIAVGIEKTAVQVANHAKDKHSFAHPLQSTPGRRMSGKQRKRWAMVSRKSLHAADRYQNITGHLTASITQKLNKVTIDEISAIIFSTMEYAPYIELGTGRHPPFPFLYPALIANAENLKNNIKQALGW